MKKKGLVEPSFLSPQNELAKKFRLIVSSKKKT